MLIGMYVYEVHILYTIVLLTSSRYIIIAIAFYVYPDNLSPRMSQYFSALSSLLP